MDREVKHWEAEVTKAVDTPITASGIFAGPT
jgi:hypothetical protein